MRRALFALLLIVTLIASVPFQTPVAAAPTSNIPQPEPDFRYFPETGQQIGLWLRRWYDAHGGENIFGKPLTREFTEDGKQVMYFEYARFEINANAAFEARVQMSRIGALVTANRQNEEPFLWRSGTDDPTRSFYVESGHTLGGAFRYFWEVNGGLGRFGFPISEEFSELQPTTGQELLVQYFERAKFEYHPDKVGTPQEVQMTPLGRELLKQRPANQVHATPVKPLQMLGRATTGFPGSAYDRRTNIVRATELFDGVVIAAGKEHSFLSASDFSEAAGFVEGYGIVNGRLERVIGGGLCQVSTTLYRAVANSGLQVTRRIGHSYVVYFYENILGFDATVFSPGVDFRWRNDTTAPVIVSARTNLENETVTFEMWGISDGRTVTYQGPIVKNVTQPGTPIWQYDSALPKGAVRHLVHGRAGMDVNLIRTIRNANGSVRSTDNWYTNYQPWDDFFAYGPGVTPPPGVRVIEPRR